MGLTTCSGLISLNVARCSKLTQTLVLQGCTALEQVGIELSGVPLLDLTTCPAVTHVSYQSGSQKVVGAGPAVRMIDYDDEW